MNLDLNRITLRFKDPSTERAYREHALTFRRYLSVAAPVLVIVLFSGLCSISDFRLAPPNLDDLVFIRYLVVAPLSLLLIPHALKASYSGLQINGLASTLTVGLSQVAITQYSPPEIGIAWFGIYLAIFVGTLILTALDHLTGLLVCLLIFLAHAFVALEYQALDWEIFLIQAIATLSTLALLAIGRYLMELQSRANFISRMNLLATTDSLKQREQQLTALYENAPVPYLTVCGDDWSIREHNQAFARLLGLDGQNLVGRSWLEFRAETPDSPILAVDQVKRQIGSANREIPLRHADGHKITTLVSMTQLADNGRPENELGLSLVDITERREAEAKLQLTLKAVDASADMAFWFRADDGGVAFANRTAEQLLGYSHEALTHLTVMDFVPELNLETWRSRMAVVKGLDIAIAERVFRSRDGREFPVETSSRYVTIDGAGMLVSFARDISKRREEEHRTQAAHQNLATMALINEAIRSARTEKQLLQDICRILVEANGQRFAWVGYARDDANRSIEPAARYGYEKGYLDEVKWSWHADAPEPSPSGRAILTGKPAQISRVGTHISKRTKPALERDFHSLLALPLSQGGDAFAVLSLYSEIPESYDEERVASLQRVAESVAYGIQALRSRLSKESAEQELKTEEERSRQLLGSVAEGILGLDTSDRITFINPVGANMLGWEPDALIGRRMHPLIHYSHPDGSPYPEEECWINKTCHEGVAHTIDNEVFWHNDGHAVEVEYASLPIEKDGELMGAVISFRDISRLQSLNAQLQEAEKENKALREKLRNDSL